MNGKMKKLFDKYSLLISWWHSLNITDDAALAEAFNGHIINFAYNSGNIENPNVTYHDTREVFEHDGVSSYTGDLRTLFEIRNAKVAMEYFFKAFREKLPFDETFIKELQRRLTLNTYDERRWQNAVGSVENVPANTKKVIMLQDVMKPARLPKMFRTKCGNCWKI